MEVSSSAHQQVGKFVADTFLDGERIPESEEQLFGNGLITSVGLLKLIVFLEDQFNIEIDDDDLLPQHFETISRIIALVDSKLTKN